MKLRNDCNPLHPTHVNSGVETLNQREAMASLAERRFVKVAPPTVHAGIGDALRQAFQMDGESRSLHVFEDLLSRLK